MFTYDSKPCLYGYMTLIYQVRAEAATVILFQVNALKYAMFYSLPWNT